MYHAIWHSISYVLPLPYLLVLVDLVLVHLLVVHSVFAYLVLVLEVFLLFIARTNRLPFWYTNASTSTFFKPRRLAIK